MLVQDPFNSSPFCAFSSSSWSSCLLQAAKKQLEQLNMSASQESLEVQEAFVPAPPVVPWASGEGGLDDETIPATAEELAAFPKLFSEPPGTDASSPEKSNNDEQKPDSMTSTVHESSDEMPSTDVDPYMECMDISSDDETYTHIMHWPGVDVKRVTSMFPVHIIYFL